MSPVKRTLAGLRASLPERAFQRRPSKVLYAGIHLSIIGFTYIAARQSTSFMVFAPLSLIAGHSVFCVALFAHELSHGAILPEGWARRLLTQVCWGVNWISPTMWNGVHNRTHHHHTNTNKDPDRRFLAEEASPLTRVYTRLFYPQAGVVNPFVLIHFVPYVIKQTVGALVGGDRTLSLIPQRSRFTRRERWLVAMELALIAVFQLGLYRMLGGDGHRYLMLGVAPVCWASAFTMSYVFTNHFLMPVSSKASALENTTSVRVPAWIDYLHINFSYHIEHHLFPSMNSSFAPALSKLLLARFGDGYHRVPIADAWRELWRQSPFANGRTARAAPSSARIVAS